MEKKVKIIKAPCYPNIIRESALSISSLNCRFYFYFSNLNRNYKNYNFSNLKISLGRKKSIFVIKIYITIKTFHDIIILMPNIYDQSL